MADNVTIDNGALTDYDVSTDESAGGQKIQRVKLASSADASEVHVTADADGLLVNLGANNDVTLAPATTGGLSFHKSIDLDESEEEIKATAGQVYTLYAFNATTSKLYLKLYNATAANVTVGTTTPVLTFVLPTDGVTGGGISLTWTQGLAFSTAISAACTTGLADNDTGAPAANACVVAVGYK